LNDTPRLEEYFLELLELFFEWRLRYFAAEVAVFGEG
jgi:hypothetical protein